MTKIKERERQKENKRESPHKKKKHEKNKHSKQKLITYIDRITNQISEKEEKKTS